MDDCGFDMLGAEVTIPTVGANYTDAKTVTAVQYALVKKGYNLGTTGPNHDGVDGDFGPKTSAACKKIQAIANSEQNGRIDETVIMALKVTPGVLPPGVTAAGRAAVQAQVALEAATKAEHAQSAGEVVQAAQAVADAMVFEPDVVTLPVKKALEKAKAATTPEQVKDAAKDVQAAAQGAAKAVAPAWPVWKIAAVAGGGLVAVGALLFAVLSGGKVAQVTQP
jgi:peptidoglycan hydrolase-like protein with peptidoglycan-binding domain